MTSIAISMQMYSVTMLPGIFLTTPSPLSLNIQNYLPSQCRCQCFIFLLQTSVSIHVHQPQPSHPNSTICELPPKPKTREQKWTYVVQGAGGCLERSLECAATGSSWPVGVFLNLGMPPTWWAMWAALWDRQLLISGRDPLGSPKRALVCLKQRECFHHLRMFR